MANGYGVCPQCGYTQQGPWQGAQIPQWQGQAWMGPPMMVCQPMIAPPWAGQGFYGQQMFGGPPAYGPPYYGNLPTDEEIEEMIFDAIDADPLIPFDANIDVSVDAGTVFLRGEVPSKRIKHAAGDDAWWIPGVDDVHNDIAVTPRKQSRQEQKQAEPQA